MAQFKHQNQKCNFSLIIDPVEFSPYKTWCIPVQSLFTHINWNTPLFGFPTHQPWPQNTKKNKTLWLSTAVKLLTLLSYLRLIKSVRYAAWSIVYLWTFSLHKTLCRALLSTGTANNGLHWPSWLEIAFQLLYWDAVTSGMTSFPALTSELQGKWNAP